MEPRQDINQQMINHQEANQPVQSTGTGDVVFSNKPKSGKAMIIGMIILTLLATGGIGFGVWAMLDRNAQIEKKNEEIAAQNDKSTNKTKTENGSTVTTAENEAEAIGDNTISDTANINTSEYFYIGEWGIKIRIGDLRVVGTRVFFSSDLENISVAVSPQDQFKDASGNYFSNSSYPAVTITRSEQPTIKPYAFMGIQDDYSPVYNDGVYNYFVYTPTGFAVEGLANPDAITGAYDSMVTLMNNSDNYSKI